MNLSETLSNFRPGHTIAREEFTSDVQNSLVNNYFGIQEADTPAPVNENQVVLDKAKYAEMEQTLDNFRKVFNAPGVAEQLGDIIMGRNSTPVHNPAPQTPQTNTQPVNAGMTQPQPNQNPQGQQSQPSPNPAGNQNESQGGSENSLWNEIFGTSSSQTTSEQDTRTQDNQSIAQNQGQQSQQQQFQQPQQPQSNETQPRGNEVVERYVNDIAAVAVKEGLDPQDVLGFLDGMDAKTAVNIYKQVRSSQGQQEPEPTNINLVEQREPDRPIRINTGFGSGFRGEGLKV